MLSCFVQWHRQKESSVAEPQACYSTLALLRGEARGGSEKAITGVGGAAVPNLFIFSPCESEQRPALSGEALILQPSPQGSTYGQTEGTNR